MGARHRHRRREGVQVTVKPNVAICLLCTLPTASLAAADDPLAKARGLLLGGQYAEAAEIYAPLAEKEPAAALGLARSLSSQGKQDEAVRALTAAAGNHPQLHAELARLAFDRGDYETAQARAEKAIQLDGDQPLGRWILAELHRTAGRLEEAEAGYRRLISFYNNRDVDSAESLRWIGLAAARYARWNRLSDQFSFLVNELYPDALKLEPGYWPAAYESGMLFLEKYNRPEAAEEFQTALKLTPYAAEAHVGLARLAMAAREIDRAEACLDEALRINPRLLSAWLEKADLAWANFKVREALKLLQEKALPLNPVSEETLGRLAACYVLLDGMPEPGQNTRFSRLVEKVVQRNPHAGEFFHTLGAELQARGKLAEAEVFFRVAIRKMPQRVGPRAHLGMLYMRAGCEAEARKLLDEAFGVDPFNLRVNNSLEVLDVLDTMKTRETDHVVIRYDGRHDELLARYAGRYLDTFYPRWCRRFGYRPPRKPLLEVFNRARGISGQEWFSTRMIGLPHLGPVAASTGRVVAMASPNEPQSGRRYNWARVLRHELTHVITLQQTRFNIPHWYAEGLAVHSEQHPRPPRWDDLLLRRVPAGRLLNLQTINFAFTRPDSSDDWQLAYCQAELYVQYMLWRWGPGPGRKLLAAYAEGLTTRDAIPRALAVSQEEFERGYVAYLKRVTAGLSRLQWPSNAGFEQLLAAHRRRPQAADPAAELAYAYLRRGADKEALETAELALRLRPQHPLATYVRARLLLGDGKAKQAVEMLEDCLDRQHPQPNALNLLAALKLKAGQYKEAAELYALGERLDPINPKWTRALMKVYEESNDRHRLPEVLKRLARADLNDPDVRTRLAQIALEERDFETAAEWAKRGLEIDVMDGKVHRVFAQALVGCHDYQQAIEEFEVAIELDPIEPGQRFALADACLQAQQPQKACKVLEDLLVLAPDYPGAAQLLENLKESELP